jgi:hypothetical protein
MTLDPTIAAAIVTAAGGLAKALLQKLLEGAGRSSPDAETRKVLSKVYEKVADAVSPNSLRALVVLQDIGAFQLPVQIAEQAKRLASRQEPDGKPFEPDITYRLRYLCLLGLARVGTSDFALTRFGAAFIDQARRDKLRYTRVFTTLGA